MESPDQRTSRRGALQTAAVLPFPMIRSSAANSAVAVGLIGAGGRGRLDAGLLIEHTPARLAAVCDIVPAQIERARARLAAKEWKAYTDYQELLASPVDAVLIATPVYLHPEHLEAAVRAGKHVYIEKPAGADAAGCRRVLRAGAAAGTKLNITFGFQQRYGPGYRKAHELVTSGGIGTLRLAHSHWLKGTNVPRDATRPARPSTPAEKLKQWKLWRETFGDFIVETYCHGVDVLNWFMGGPPVKAVASGAQIAIRRGDQRDHCSAVFTYAGGTQATLTGTQIAPPFFRDVRETFFGSEAVVETAREFWRVIRSSANVREEKEPHDITIEALREFVARVREGRPENTAKPAAESTLAAILARTAMDEGREVKWEEVAG